MFSPILAPKILNVLRKQRNEHARTCKPILSELHPKAARFCVAAKNSKIFHIIKSTATRKNIRQARLWMVRCLSKYHLNNVKRGGLFLVVDSVKSVSQIERFQSLIYL